MKKITPIDADRCNELFEYRDGQLIRKVATSTNVKVGDIAGYVHKKNGYSVVGIDGKQIYGHRVIYAMHFGDPAEKEIDHINHDRSDNRIENLRMVTSGENGKNLSMSGNNSSGIIGVSLFAATGKWQVYIDSNGKRIHLGHFKKKRDAIFRRRLAEIAYGYHPNHGK